MVESALRTSRADVALYVDGDDRDAAAVKALESDRVRVMVGPPIGRGAAVNALCQNLHYRMYLVVSDDIVFIRDGWDRDIVQAMDSFADDIGVVHLAGSNPQQSIGEPWVNWACVSKKWIDALGWFNYPGCRSFCQDTVLQVLAEALGRIKRIDEVALHHECIDHPDMLARLQHDTHQFLWFCARDFGPCLAKLRKAQNGS